MMLALIILAAVQVDTARTPMPATRIE